MNIRGKNVLITGSNRGIGYALSKEFAKNGANLVMGMREVNEKLVLEMKSLGAGSVLLRQLDMSTFESIENFAKELEKDKIKIDILVNNAGVLTGGLLEAQDMSSVYKMMQVNLNAPLHLTKLILPQMLKRNSGKIVNNASISAILNLPSASTYSAAKAGVAAFTRCLDQELEGTGVSTLLLITPGVETRMYKEVRKVYAGHMKVSAEGGTISAEVWAKKIIGAVESDKRELWPSGGTNFVGRLYTVFPSIVRLGTRRIFKRS